jgi:hypothetical protein
MTATDLREAREAVVRTHFESETAQDFDVTLATFDHPRYEVIATQSVYDGAEEVMNYYTMTRTAFPRSAPRQRAAASHRRRGRRRV